MKALELNIYPPLECKGDRPKDRLKHEFAKGAEWKQGQAKRLTSAELAAEAYKAEAEFLTMVTRYYPGDSCKRASDQGQTMHRFATLPHYDEVTK